MTTITSHANIGSFYSLKTKVTFSTISNSHRTENKNLLIKLSMSSLLISINEGLCIGKGCLIGGQAVLIYEDFSASLRQTHLKVFKDSLRCNSNGIFWRFMATSSSSWLLVNFCSSLFLNLGGMTVKYFSLSSKVSIPF